MILKYMRNQIKSLITNKYRFAQPPKKRTEAPKYRRSKQSDKVDPTKINYEAVPQDIRKGVKAYVQAKNILVSSQAQLQSISLKQIILEERNKFKQTLDKIGQQTIKPIVKQQNLVQKKEQQSNYYDLMKAIRFTSNVSNLLMIANIAGYGILHTFKKYQFLGFFLGLSMNPSIITLTALGIGFNAASWIIIQSLHLSIRDPNQLTLDKISLTNCSVAMYLQALSIGIQTCGLSYYLMQPNPGQNIPFLIGSFALAQAQLTYNIIRSTGGYKLQYFSKMLITQITAAFIICVLVYALYSKIDECKNMDKYGDILNQKQILTLDENFRLKKGYQRFLSEFKQRNYQVVKGQAINKLLSQQSNKQNI